MNFKCSFKDTSVEPFYNEFISSSENIYDIYVKLYTILTKNEHSVFEFLLNQRSENIQKCQNKIKAGIKKVGPFLYPQDKSNLKQLLHESFIDVPTTIFSLFIIIDDKFGLQTVFTDERIIEKHPLNRPGTYHYGKVYHRKRSFLELFYDESFFPKDDAQIGFNIERYQNSLMVVTNETNDYIPVCYEIGYDYLWNMLSELNGKIRIALLPFTGDHSYICFKREMNPDHLLKGRFFLEKLNNEEKYIEKMLYILRGLMNEGIHIVVFPEMVFSGKMLKAAKKFLAENKNRFLLIISGSIWENQSNRCVLLRGDGVELSAQYKLNPYSYYDEEFSCELFEGIIQSERKLNLYDIEGLGRICTPICVDFVNSNCFKILSDMRANILFIPAYTRSLHAFHTNSNEFGKQNKGSVFIANCCAAMVNLPNGNKRDPDKKTEITFYYVPVKNIKSKDCMMESCCPKKPDCGITDRDFCFYLIEFSGEAREEYICRSHKRTLK